jgi:uncharacterized protein (UPF0548 family)
VFSLRHASPARLASLIAKARSLDHNYDAPLGTELGLEGVRVPPGFVLDHTRSVIGNGAATFSAAKALFRTWTIFDLGWVRVANPGAKIEVGETVAVEAHSLSLWSINISRILYVIDEPGRFGFGYGTTALHVESGEERFLLEYDANSGNVFYDLLAISRPAHWLARLAYPFTRSQQRRFARESQRRMLAQLNGPEPVDF